MALGEHDLRPPLLRNKETRNLLPSLNWQKHWSQEPDSVRSNRTGSTASTLSPTGEASGSNPVKSGFESQRVYALLAQRRGSWLNPAQSGFESLEAHAMMITMFFAPRP